MAQVVKRPEWKENAKVLAAAPKMLKALHDIVSNFLREDQVEEWYELHKNNKGANPILIKAIEAIKEATE